MDYLTGEWASAVGAAMRTARMYKKLSQDQVAEDVGVTRQAISSLERGVSFSLSLFVETCLVLSVDPSSIWGQAREILRGRSADDQADAA